MLRRIANILAVLTVIGYVLLYSFWPISLVLGTYEGTLWWNDPKNIGLSGLYDLLRDAVLPLTCLMVIVGVVMLLVHRLIPLFSTSTTVSYTHLTLPTSDLV